MKKFQAFGKSLSKDEQKKIKGGCDPGTICDPGGDGGACQQENDLCDAQHLCCSGSPRLRCSPVTRKCETY